MSRDRSSRWLLALLLLALAAGMVFTLWAGLTGRVRSRHGALGKAPLASADPFRA